MREHSYKLRKPVEFEGKTYQEVDFGNIENLTTKDLREIEKEVQTHGQTLINMEFSTVGCCAILRKATGLPAEFFDKVSFSDMSGMKYAVVNFLNGRP